MSKITTGGIRQIAEWTAAGLLTAEIAERLGVATKTIERYRVQYGIEVPSRRTHGLNSTYNSGCRCGACTDAHTEYTLAKRAARYRSVAESGLPSHVRHGLSAARNWGCRCDICVEAVRVANAEYYRARRGAR